MRFCAASHRPNAYARPHTLTHVWSYGSLRDFLRHTRPRWGCARALRGVSDRRSDPARTQCRAPFRPSRARPPHFRPALARICRAVPRPDGFFAPDFRFSVPGFYRPDPLKTAVHGVCKPYTTFFRARVFEYRCFVSS